MTEYAGQSIFHAFVAALVVEALLRTWRIDDSQQRLAYRLLALAVPLLMVPGLHWLLPARADPLFRERWALFVSTRWDAVRIGGVGLFTVWLAALSVLGTLLLAIDLIPLVARWRDSLASKASTGARDGVEARECRDWMAELCRSTGIREPPLVLLDDSAPRLFCAGALRPRLVVSRGTLALLDPAELRGAIAHELGHVLWRDPLRGWLLALGRLLLFFNPVFHVVARVYAFEAEWRADDFAARVTGNRLAVASGLLKLARASGRGNLPDFMRASLMRARAMAIEARCRRLLSPTSPSPVLLGAARLALTSLSLAVLLSLVV